MPYRLGSESADLQSHQWLPEGESLTRYYYVGAKVQAGGRGFLGFREVLSHDPQTGMLTRTRYDQRFPFIGSPIETEVSWQPGAPWPQFDTETPLIPWPSCDAGSIRSGVRLSCSLNELSQRSTAGASVHPFISRSEVRTWQPSMAGGMPSLSVFSHRVVTSNENVDVHGNVGRVVVETARSVEGPVWPADRLSRQVSDQTYGPGPAELRFGRLTCSVVTHERPGVPSITRRSSYGYDARGLLARETVEPSTCAANPSGFEANTVYQLDAFGNRTQTLVTARGEAEPRGTWVQYDPRGRFVDVERVRLGGGVWRFTSEVLARDRYGNATRVRAGSGVESLAYFDPLGRPHYQHSPDGAWSRVLWRPGAGPHCPAGTALHEIKTAAGGAETMTCKDRLGRAVRTVAWTIDGASFRQVYSDVHYDFAARPVAATEPYRPGTTDQVYWTRTAYDEFGRLEFTRTPDGGLSSQSYVPRAQGGIEEIRTVTDAPNGISRTMRTETDALGETVLEVAADTGETTHGRDALGRVVWTDGPLPGAVDRIGIAYTVTGHRIEVIDPDKGTWRYAVNGFGEVTCQLDAKSQAQWHRYDALGRMLRREVRTGVLDVNACTGTQVGWTEWVYGNLNGVGDFGQVMTVAHSQTEAAPVGQVLELATLSYDALGRLTLRRTDLREPGTGGNFVVYEERTTYDQFGRVFQVFDASGGNRGVRHHYDSRGHLTGLREARQGASGRLYWELLGTDARGQATWARLGNGMEVWAEREPETGRLRRLRDQLGGTVAQDLELWWDRLGQLQARRDLAAGARSERFVYDARGRLTETWDLAGQGFRPGTLAGTQVQSQSYDLSGNISWKSDVGSYQYGAKPHAVTSAGGVTYSYDANGNVTQDGTGRTFTVSARDQVIRVARGGEESRFWYGSSGGRVVHTQFVNGVVTERTHYIGGVEVVHRNGSREFRRSLGGSAQATFFEATQVDQVRYLHRDHLGSTVAISDESGQVIQRMNFDPWGQRRAASPWWPQQAIPTGQLAAIRAITPRGYTGHEHLDALGIIHMNGRIYDPRLARFLQADPLIEDGSTLNRYTYVHNDPLAYTDPSGYWGRREQNGLRTIIAIAITVFTGLEVRALVLAEKTAQAFALAAAGGAVAGGIQSGTVEGAAWGAFSAAVFFGIGQAIQGADSLHNITATSRTLSGAGWAVKTVSHGLAGGTISHLQGGKFGHGFASAAGSAATAPLVDASSANVVQGAVVTTLVGGTLSRISGGKFANGALTAAMSYAFNQVVSNANMPNSANRWSTSDAILSDSFDQRAIDIDAAIKKIHEIMEPKATGWCARHVRKGLEAGGADMAVRPGVAREYGPKLTELGFVRVDVNSGYVPQRGDIAVFQNYENQRHNAGHIQIFDGAAWVSDFKQTNFLPHRSRYHGVHYEIFRP